MRRTCSTLLLATMLTALAAEASGQGLAAWGWGFGSPTAPSAKWSPEAFADYIGTGQTPHPAVARIIAPENSGTSMGSGILVDINRNQGLVLTNWHVIRDSRSGVLVQFPDGFQSAGTVVRWDEPWDLAAIVIWKPNATPVSLAPEKPVPGEPLTIAGYGRGPFRTETGPCTQYLAPGSGYPMEFVELSATARQGDSGGPIFNTRGELAGVLFGQNDGRTIGSCTTRLRAFLADVGSSGFQALPIAEFSAEPAIDRSLGTPAPPTRLASATDAEIIHRSAHVAEPQPPAGYAPPEPTLEQLLDVRTNGQTMLTAAGGVALVILGLRTIFGGRTRQPSYDP
ncbi:MAG: serine protease [Planctomycetia bacterium]